MELNPCPFCGGKYYIKTTQYSRLLLAPLTRVGELMDELLGLTGEIYVETPSNFCPNCGAKMDLEEN